MTHSVGIDVSLETSSICIVDQTGRVVRELTAETEPEALAMALLDTGLAFARVGLEAGPLSQWLHAGLTRARLPVMLIETRRLRAATKTMPVKTDRNDARAIAQVVRTGWFRAVHVKSALSQELRALLTARKLLVAKLRDLDSGVRGLLRGFGLKVGQGGSEASPAESENSSKASRSKPSSSRSCGLDPPSLLSEITCTVSSWQRHAGMRSVEG